MTSEARKIKREHASVIVGGARTPFGKLLGGLAGFSAAQLGGIAIAGALERVGITHEQVDQVIMGSVIQAGQGQNPARQAALAAGFDYNTPALTINNVCLSGLRAIALADQLIRAGEAEIVVAGGMESMTNAPHLLPMRKGVKYGEVAAQDAMALDALTCAFDAMSMGSATENYQSKYTEVADLSRSAQDELSLNSHLRAAAAQEQNLFAEEIVPVEVPQRRGEPVVVAADESVRAGTTAEALAKLRASFAADGTITAGNSSPISDGAAAVVVMSSAAAQRLGVIGLARIVSHAGVAGPDPSLHEQPARAVKAALAKIDTPVRDVSLFEINEAFATVALVSMAELGVGPEKVNVNGGAIALGHPVGASGARIVFHLARLLQQEGAGSLGAAALCGGGGQGDALILEGISA